MVVTGSECTGKTTLAKALAACYQTVWVPEFARSFVIDKCSAPEYQDVGSIARGQIALEEERGLQASTLLIHDTDLLSTILYSRHYFGDCPRWIEVAFEKRAADLYLLADIDVPWVSNGEQRDRGDRREEMHELFRSALSDHHLSFAEIRGSQGERLEVAVSGIERVIRGHPSRSR